MKYKTVRLNHSTDPQFVIYCKRRLSDRERERGERERMIWPHCSSSRMMSKTFAETLTLYHINRTAGEDQSSLIGAAIPRSRRFCDR